MPQPLEQIEQFKEGLVSKDTISMVQFDSSAAYDIKNVEYHPRGSISKREGYQAYIMSGEGGSGPLADRCPLSAIMHIYPWVDSTGADHTLVYTSTCADSWPTPAPTLSADLYSLSFSGGNFASSALSAIKLFSADRYPNAVANRTLSSLWSPCYTADHISIASYAGSAIAVWGGDWAPPLVFSGGSTSAVPATSWHYSGAKHIEPWGSYLFMGNFCETADNAAGYVRNRSRVQWNLGAGSVWASATSWPASYYIDVDPDDGDEITGLKLLKEYMVVFKKNKIFLIWYTGDATIFTFRRQVTDVGCIAPNSIVQKGDYLYFLSDKGFYRFDGEGATEISQKIKHYITDHVSHSLVSVCHAGLYDLHRQIWFAVNYDTYNTASEDSDNKRKANAIFVYDTEMKNWTIYDIPASALATCMLNQQTKKADLVIGTLIRGEEVRKGALYQYGNAFTSDISGTAINSYWVSRWLDGGNPMQNKRLLRTTILADQEGTQTDTYDLTWEMREDWKEVAFSGVLGAMSGNVQLTGSSTTLSGETVSTTRTGLPMEIRMDMSRTLRAWQFKLSNASAGNPWTVHRIAFEGIQKGQTKVT